MAKETQEKKYRVKTLSISGLHNKVYRNGDVISSSQIKPEQLESLLAQEALEEVTSISAEQVLKPEEKQPVIPNSPDEMIPHTVTQADVDANPTAGLVVGEIINVPAPKESVLLHLYSEWQKAVTAGVQSKINKTKKAYDKEVAGLLAKAKEAASNA